MTQYLLPKARNTITGQTQKQQDLTGGRLSLHQRAFAQAHADQMAAKLTERTGDLWVGFVELYTPSERK